MFELILVQQFFYLILCCILVIIIAVGLYINYDLNKIKNKYLKWMEQPLHKELVDELKLQISIRDKLVNELKNELDDLKKYEECRLMENYKPALLKVTIYVGTRPTRGIVHIDINGMSYVDIITSISKVVNPFLSTVELKLLIEDAIKNKGGDIK